MEDLSTNPVAPEVETTAPEASDEEAGDQLETEAAEGSEQEQDAAEDLEEAEYEGKTYKLPKELKEALLRQADYTRKTQEVAEQRRELEQRQQAIAQQTQFQRQHIQEFAQLHALESQLQQYGQVNWQALEQEDPVRAQSLWRQYSQLKDQYGQVAGSLQQKAHQQALERQQAIAKQVQEANATLSRDIKDWGPQKYKDLMEYAVKEWGFSRAEIESYADPRGFKLLHRVHTLEQALKSKAAAPKQPAPEVKPVTTVGKSAPAAKNPEKMTTDEWMKHRNAQLRKRA